MDLLKPNQKLSLNFQKEENLVEIICTISKILEDRLVIDLPPYFMRYIEYLEVGSKLTVKVFSKLGTIDFNTVVISSPLEEDDFSVELDEEAIKLTPGSEIPTVNAIETLNIKDLDIVTTVKTFEISTDKIKFYSDKVFRLNENIECDLILPKNYGTISFRAVISDIDEVFDNEYTATYITMTESDRQMLLYYMYVYASESSDTNEK